MGWLVVLLLVSWSHVSMSEFTQAEIQAWFDTITAHGVAITANNPARVFTFKEQAVPIVRGDTELDTIVAAAELGQGRIIAVSYDTLVQDFTHNDEVCKEDKVGAQYTGTQSTAQTGRKCQNWADSTPHVSAYTAASNFPDSTMDSVSNNCRNPNSDSNGPWCYTMDPQKKKEYCAIPICPDANSAEEQRLNFQKGVKSWLTKQDYKGPDSVCIINEASAISCLEDDNIQIVVTYGRKEYGSSNPVVEKKLADWIKEGHGFAFGYRPISSEVPNLDALFYNVIVEAGIGMYEIKAVAHDQGTVFDASVKSNTLYDLYLPNAVKSLTSISSLDSPGDFLTFVVDEVIGDMDNDKFPWEMRKEVARHFVTFIDDMETGMIWPVCDYDTLVHDAASDGIIRIFRLYASLGFLGLWKTKKAPNIDHCPGDLHASDAPRVDAEVTIHSTMKQFWASGHYLAAGDKMTVTILSTSNTTFRDFSLYIGMHTDFLWKRAPWRRYPQIHAQIALTSITFTVSTPFGGLITFKSALHETYRYLKVRLSGVVKAAHYKLGDQTSMDAWHVNKESSAPWGELEGEMVTWYMPRKNLVVLDDPAEAVHYWDEVLRRSYELDARPPARRSRMSIIVDIQISGGLQHSGNPIMHDQRNYMDHTSEGFPMNISDRALKFWGYYHEMGHNLQKKEWTFDSFNEVTNNIFSMFNREFGSEAHPWETWWDIKLKQEDIVNTINQKDYTLTLQSPWYTLIIYTQLQLQFGWGCLKEIFEGYEYDKVNNPSAFPSDDNVERINMWVVRVSLQVGYNMCPLFELWSYPQTVCNAAPAAEDAGGNTETDDEDIDLTQQFYQSDLEPFLPTDHVTEITAVQPRIREIEAAYTGIIREQTNRPACYIPTFPHRAQMRAEIKTTAASFGTPVNIFPDRPNVAEKLHRIGLNIRN